MGRGLVSTAIHEVERAASTTAYNGTGSEARRHDFAVRSTVALRTHTNNMQDLNTDARRPLEAFRHRSSTSYNRGKTGGITRQVRNGGQSLTAFTA